MNYQRIFWLEDDPRHLAGVISSADLIKPGLSSSILERTVFAHDAAEGQEKLAAGTFDLIILDGDFPAKLDAQHRAKLESFIGRLRCGERIDSLNSELKSFGFDPSYGEHDWGRFESFYQHNQARIGSIPTVIHSQSLANLIPALLLGLPFYAKEPPKFDFNDYIAQSIRRKHTGRDILSEEQVKKLEQGPRQYGSVIQFMAIYLS